MYRGRGKKPMHVKYKKRRNKMIQIGINKRNYQENVLLQMLSVTVYEDMR